MGGVEPWCGLEVVGAVDGVDGPFVVVDGGVMVCTQCDEVVDVGVAAAFPGFEVVDLAPCGDDGAAWAWHPRSRARTARRWDGVQVR